MTKKSITLLQANICCTKIQHHYEVTSTIQNDDTQIIIHSEHYVVLDGDSKFIAIEDGGIASVQIGETKSSTDETMEMLFVSLGLNATEILEEIEEQGMEQMGWSRPENQSPHMKQKRSTDEAAENPFFQLLDSIFFGIKE